jgi:phage shock protein A
MQELLIAAGFNPGDEDKLGQERKFDELEKNAAADDALAALKAKMGGGSQAGD